ncbi:MAG: head GIN domain-containing protein [Saprospiraceae bacterium]
MKKFFLIPVLFSALFLASCDPSLRGKGVLVTETRNEQNFHAIDFCSSGQVEVYTDSVYSLKVTCEENIIPYLETRVENGVLKVYFSRNVWDVDGLRIRVGAPNWDGFDLSGSGSIYVNDPIYGQHLDLDISGSGKIKIADADFFSSNLRVSGSGDLYLSGIGDDLYANVSGSGNINALDFSVKNAVAKVSGSGNIRLNVLETLEVDISGSGNVEYLGSPQVNSHVSGSGNIRKI